MPTQHLSSLLGFKPWQHTCEDAFGVQKRKKIPLVCYSDTHSSDSFAKFIVCYAQIPVVNNELVTVIISYLTQAADVRGSAQRKGNI